MKLCVGHETINLSIIEYEDGTDFVWTEKNDYSGLNFIYTDLDVVSFDFIDILWNNRPIGQVKMDGRDTTPLSHDDLYMCLYWEWPLESGRPNKLFALEFSKFGGEYIPK